MWAPDQLLQFAGFRNSWASQSCTIKISPGAWARTCRHPALPWPSPQCHGAFPASPSQPGPSRPASLSALPPVLWWCLAGGGHSHCICAPGLGSEACLSERRSTARRGCHGHWTGHAGCLRAVSAAPAPPEPTACRYGVGGGAGRLQGQCPESCGLGFSSDVLPGPSEAKGPALRA